MTINGLLRWSIDRLLQESIDRLLQRSIDGLLQGRINELLRRRNNELLRGSQILTGKISGQTSVFLAITMMAVLILAGLLVDIARINAGRTIVKRAADSAAKSLLANYGSKLKEDYGIFAFTGAGASDLQDQFEELLSCNLSIPLEEDFYEGSTDLFGFRIEKVRVTPIYNLSENKVLKKQILEHMKYRAPEEMVEGFIEKLTAVRAVGKMSGAYKQKVSIDKLFGRMDKYQQNLKKSIDGLGSSIDKFINGFNTDGSWEDAFRSFNSLTEELAKLRDEIDALKSAADIPDSQISGQQEYLSEPQDSQTSKQQDSQASEQQDSKLSELQGRYSDIQSARRDIWDKLRNYLTGDYIKPNNDALKAIEKIVEKGEKARLAIDKLESYLETSFDGEEEEFLKDFREQVQKDLNDLKELILDGQKAMEMLSNAESNIRLLQEIIVKLDQSGDSTGSPPDNILDSGLLNMIRSYAKISYDYARPAKGDKKDDPREGKANAVKKFISEHILEDVNYETEGINKLDLPSYAKVITSSFDQEDEAFETEGSGGSSGSEDVGTEDSGANEAQYDGDFARVSEEMDLYDEEGMFQENALGFIDGIGKLASNGAIALRDNIYLNEYIMKTFKNSVPVLRYGSEAVKDSNLHGEEKAASETFYDSEVEYILHGQPSQMLNNIMTKGELLLVRFGLNTLHVYTDAKKKAMANGIATTVAGWWTGGAGIPVISNLIMCGWGMGESLIDLTDLMEGKSVPIYKLKGDWQLDIGIAAETGPKLDQRLYFSYYDYLRLFLLAMNEDKKLDRIGDLIQLNIGKSKNGFKMTESNTYVRIEAEVSMKHLFITRPFVQKELKTGDGRYIFKVLVYEGY